MRLIEILLVEIVSVIVVSSSPFHSVKRLIKRSENEEPRWLSELDIWNLIKKQIKFIDVTDHQDYIYRKPKTRSPKGLPTTCIHQNATKAVFSCIDDERIESFVKHFSSYHTRYYKSRTGVESQKWLLSQVEKTLEGYNAAPSSVTEFEHDWPQHSIIARIDGVDPNLTSQIIVLGAHQDSVNLWGSSFRAPGADDNAAGSVVVLESLRAIVDAGYVPKRSIEFHWYAAEEVGLRGSAAIAQAYKNDDIDVVGMLNFDVPGYPNPDGDDIGIYVDNTSPELNDFLRIAVDEYLDYGRQDAKCGYGCSDHASWTNYGYPAAMPSEVKVNPYMHTSQDNVQRVNFPQVKEFIKLALSTVVEYGLPNGA